MIVRRYGWFGFETPDVSGTLTVLTATRIIGAPFDLVADGVVARGLGQPETWPPWSADTRHDCVVWPALILPAQLQ